MEPRGSVYKENSNGPKIDPCGTPQVRGAILEENSPNFTEKLLLVK